MQVKVSQDPDGPGWVPHAKKGPIVHKRIQACFQIYSCDPNEENARLATAAAFCKGDPPFKGLYRGGFD